MLQHDAAAQASSVNTFFPCAVIEKTRRLHTKIMRLPHSNGELLTTSEHIDGVRNLCLDIGSAILKFLNCGIGDARGISDAVTSPPSKLTCYSEDKITWDSLDFTTTAIINQMPSKMTQKLFFLYLLGKERCCW